MNLKGRGSALHVWDEQRAAELNLNFCCESTTWCTISLVGADKLIIGVVYRSPASDSSNSQLLWQSLRSAINDQGPSHVLIMGDLNLPEINWNFISSTAGSSHPSSKLIE